jgi:hypothetical protein
VIGGGGVITPEASPVDENDPSLDQSNDSACGCSIPSSKKATAVTGITIGFLAMLFSRRLRRKKKT